MRYVSFSLFGNQADYLQGALENGRECHRIYPGWTPIFYVSKDLKPDLISELVSLGAIVEFADAAMSANPRVWRFAAVFRPDAESVIFRDTDSRLSDREAFAVAEWTKSGSSLHIMRDHPHHVYPIMAGMWGLRVNETTKSLVRQILRDASGDEKPEDQILLESILYPRLVEDSLVHDSFYRREKTSREFPSSRTEGTFVGERISAEGHPQDHHRQLLLKYEQNNFLIFRLRAMDYIRSILHRITGLNLLFLVKTGRTEKAIVWKR